MKLTDEERQILVNLEYEKAVAFLAQAEEMQGSVFGMSWQIDYTILYFTQYQHC